MEAHCATTCATQADTDHVQTSGMHLRINLTSDTCTVDASVAKYARVKRTLRSVRTRTCAPFEVLARIGC